MIEWNSVVIVFSVYVAGVVIPGPNFVAVAHEAISNTRKHALVLVSGIVLVNLFWAASALLGMSAVFTLFPWLALLVKFTGATYLVWFGLMLIRNANAGSSVANSDYVRTNLFVAFKKGVAVNIANPKSIAFYAAVFSAAAPKSINLATLLAMLAVVLLIAFVWYGSVALLLSSPRISKAFVRIKGWFNKICGSTIILLGIRQAFGSAS